MAKTSPGEFVRQVRAETAKVAWPTRRETLMTAVMVVIMTSILAIFFFVVDLLFKNVVRELLEFSVDHDVTQLWWIAVTAVVLGIGYMLTRRR